MYFLLCHPKDVARSQNLKSAETRGQNSKMLMVGDKEECQVPSRLWNRGH